MIRNTRRSCHRSREIGAGCSLRSHPRGGGCAVAPLPCEQVGGSIAPAPLILHQQSVCECTNSTLCDLLCLFCAPLCRGSSGRSPVRGRPVSGAVCPGSRGGLRPELDPAARPRCCTSRHPYAKRLHPYRVAFALGVACQGWRGFLLRVASGSAPVLGEGVIL